MISAGTNGGSHNGDNDSRSSDSKSRSSSTSRSGSTTATTATTTTTTTTTTVSRSSTSTSSGSGGNGSGSMGNLGVMALRDHMIRMYHTACLDNTDYQHNSSYSNNNNNNSGITDNSTNNEDTDNGTDKMINARTDADFHRQTAKDEDGLGFVMGEGRAARSLRRALVAIGTTTYTTLHYTTLLVIS